MPSRPAGCIMPQQQHHDGMPKDSGALSTNKKWPHTKWQRCGSESPSSSRAGRREGAAAGSAAPAGPAASTQTGCQQNKKIHAAHLLPLRNKEAATNSQPVYGQPPAVLKGWHCSNEMCRHIFELDCVGAQGSQHRTEPSEATLWQQHKWWRTVRVPATHGCTKHTNSQRRKRSSQQPYGHSSSGSKHSGLHVPTVRLHCPSDWQTVNGLRSKLASPCLQEVTHNVPCGQKPRPGSPGQNIRPFSGSAGYPAHCTARMKHRTGQGRAAAGLSQLRQHTGSLVAVCSVVCTAACQEKESSTDACGCQHTSTHGKTTHSTERHCTASHR